jgi:hypothetical protein
VSQLSKRKDLEKQDFSRLGRESGGSLRQNRTKNPKIIHGITCNHNQLLKRLFKCNEFKNNALNNL